MKIKGIVVVDIDTERDGKTDSSGKDLPADNHGISQFLAKVKVRKDVPGMGADLTSAVAHEFGHVIAAILKLPEFESLERTNFLHNIGIAPGTAILPREKEAWDVAEKMGLPIDQYSKKHALDSYEQKGPFYEYQKGRS